MKLILTVLSSGSVSNLRAVDDPEYLGEFGIWLFTLESTGADGLQIIQQREAGEARFATPSRFASLRQTEFLGGRKGFALVAGGMIQVISKYLLANGGRGWFRVSFRGSRLLAGEWAFARWLAG